jgi:hypothetical protein
MVFPILRTRYNSRPRRRCVVLHMAADQWCKQKQGPLRGDMLELPRVCQILLLYRDKGEFVAGPSQKLHQKAPWEILAHRPMSCQNRQ